MVGKHYKWQQRWTVDVEAREARFDAGALVFDWQPGAAALPSPLGALCWDSQRRSWVGTLRGGMASVNAWLATQPNIRDETSQRTRLERMGREAATIFAEALRGQA